MPEPIVVVGGGLLLLAMLGGKKKKGPAGPLAPGDTPTPLPPGNKKGGSDPLPGGTKYGHLPKNKGYVPPEGMTDSDIWVSPDCQAYIMGNNWLPRLDGQTSPGMFFYENYLINGSEWMNWFFANADNLSYSKREVGYLYSGFPLMSPMDDFVTFLMQQLSPLCAEQIPRPVEYNDEAEYKAAYNDFAKAFPALDELYGYIIKEAANGGFPEFINIPPAEGVDKPDFVAIGNMQAVWDGWNAQGYLGFAGD